MEVFTFKICFLVGLMISPLPSSGNIMNTHFLQELNPRNGIPDAAPLFYTDSLFDDSLLACLMRCLSYSKCVSVFLSTTGVCRGYPFLHFQNGSIGLVFSEGETYFQKGEFLFRSSFIRFFSKALVIHTVTIMVWICLHY